MDKSALSQSKNLLHFNKKQIVPPISLTLSKKPSILLSNRLTKNYFSLHDTSLQNRNTVNKSQLKQAVREIIRIRDSKSKLLGRYNSQKSQTSKQYHNITQAFIPKISLKIKDNKQTPGTKRTKSLSSHPFSNKFKLLFRQPERKTLSERKKQRLSRKISNISTHNQFLQSLKPKLPPPEIIEKPKPRGTLVQKQRIVKLIRNLIKYLNLYFSMYKHPKKVGDLLRNVEGWNNRFRDIFLENNQAKFITKDEDILKQFWIFKDETIRPETFAEQDLYLFNILQNFYLKMEKSYNDIKKTFIHFQNVKIQKVKKQIAMKLNINEQKLTSNAYHSSRQLNKIVQFIDTRRRHNQGRRQASMTKLESLGVRFNVEERSKELIVRQKEKIMKSILVSDFKSK